MKEIVIDMRDLIEDIQTKVNNGQSVRIQGEGVSMLPFITDRDTLTLNKPSGTVKVGEVYLYKRCGGSYAIHRVYAVRKDAILMLGDAQLLIEQIPKSSLVAVVTAVEGPHKYVDCTQERIRRQSAVRMKKRVYKAKIRRCEQRLIARAKRIPHKVKKLFTKER